MKKMAFSALVTLKPKNSYKIRKLLFLNGFTIYLAKKNDSKLKPFTEDYSSENEKIIFLDENIFFFCVWIGDKPLPSFIRDELDYNNSIISARISRDEKSNSR